MVIRKQAFTLLEVLLAILLLGMFMHLLQPNIFSLREKKRNHVEEMLIKELATLHKLARLREQDLVVSFTQKNQTLFLQVTPKQWRYLDKRFAALSLEGKKTLLFAKDGSCIGEKFFLEYKGAKNKIVIDPQYFCSYQEYEQPLEKLLQRPEQLLCN